MEPIRRIRLVGLLRWQSAQGGERQVGSAIEFASTQSRISANGTGVARDLACRKRRRPKGRLPSRCQVCFGQGQRRLDRFQLIFKLQRPGVIDAQAGKLGTRLLGQPVRPATDSDDLGVKYIRLDVFIQHPRRADRVVPRQGVLDRFVHYALGFVPPAGADIELWHDRGLCSAQALPQKGGKEMVVAVPLSLVIEGDEKEVGAFAVIQDRCACRRTTDGGRPGFWRFVFHTDVGRRSFLVQDRVAQRNVEPLQDRSVKQKCPHLSRLASHHFVC